jgi:hypothetical protein
VNDIPFEFYRIDSNFELTEIIDIKENEAILYCNFFGIKSTYVDYLILVYKDHLIIDNSHSFYNTGYPLNPSFTTARKYFGVPDGAFLYTPDNLNVKHIERNTSISTNHLVHRLIGLQTKAYNEFTTYEKSLDSRVQLISILSEKILKTLDYNKIRDSRNRNFDQYKKDLGAINTLIIDDTASDCFCYPLLLEKSIPREKLYKKDIFIPTYWMDVINRKTSSIYKLECDYSLNILPLPIDHRYDSSDINRVIDIIKSIYNE